ncbi:MAG: multicopper oxidase family protein [Rhodospirillales bacterium]
MSRRAFLLAGLGAAAAPVLFRRPASASVAERRIALIAAPDRARLISDSRPETAVWCFNGRVPGPAIRCRQGERLTVTVENRLAEETTVHWHGIRVPNAMDGVPHLTQKPIAPGETFTYAFETPDAGTFWYHPHQRSFEQVGRGLYGALIVEERAPLSVDRDVTWVLDDWRLLKSAQISNDFGDFHDMSHAGRIGNTITVNGRAGATVPVRAGERIRLRLVNAANARIFSLDFAGHRPHVVALDGQPVEPHVPDGNKILLGPAMRVDLIVDMTGRPGRRYSIQDRFYRRLEYPLLDLLYADEPLRASPPETPIRLPDNPLAEPDLKNAARHRITFGGGMMGGMASAMMAGRRVDMRAMMHNGKAWAVNGIAADGHVMEPLLTLTRGRSYVLDLDNDTAWPHPIHLHGHSFRVISRNGRPTRHREWLDTILMMPRERAEIAFVADNPGDWMFHCHILEHQAGGMMAVLRVT